MKKLLLVIGVTMFASYSLADEPPQQVPLRNWTVPVEQLPHATNGRFVAANTSIPSGALNFVAIAPCRIVDTRGAVGPFGGPALSAGETRSYRLPNGGCGVPTANAYSLNVAILGYTSSAGFLVVYPTGGAWPGTSNINFGTGLPISNAVIAGADPTGSINVYASADTNVIIDINGYFVDASAPPNPACWWSTATGTIAETCGKLGIGTSTPAFALDVQPGAFGGGPIANTNYGVGVSGQFTGRSARGTQSAPAQTQADDFLGIFSGRGYETTTPGFTGRTGAMAIHAAQNFTGSAQGTYIAFETTALNAASAPTERLRVTADGSVGIGTTSPSARLDVAGNANVTGNLNVTGTITAQYVLNSVYMDVAEWVEAEGDPHPGTVVVLDPADGRRVVPSHDPYDTTVAGVVSERPGIVLGREEAGKSKIATSGRVHVRVTARDNPIRVGDLLVTSGVPGTAMRSKAVTVDGRLFHQPGTIIGKALEPLASGSGEILVLLSLQ